jgi:hypothetical protein
MDFSWSPSPFQGIIYLHPHSPRALRRVATMLEHTSEHGVYWPEKERALFTRALRDQGFEVEG